jgi:hypothetical protein
MPDTDVDISATTHDIIAAIIDGSLFEDKLVYLASPYSSKMQEVMRQNYVHARSAAARLFQAGINLYSPIVNWHPVAEAHGAPTDAESYKTLDTMLLNRCDIFMVLGIFGWNQSIGVAHEYEVAYQKGIPLLWLHPASLVTYSQFLDLYVMQGSEINGAAAFPAKFQVPTWTPWKL